MRVHKQAGCPFRRTLVAPDQTPRTTPRGSAGALVCQPRRNQVTSPAKRAGIWSGSVTMPPSTSMQRPPAMHAARGPAAGWVCGSARGAMSKVFRDWSVARRRRTVSRTPESSQGSWSPHDCHDGRCNGCDRASHRGSQLLARARMAALDRSVGRGDASRANARTVSRGSLRTGGGRRIDRAPEAGAVAAEAAAAVGGCWLTSRLWQSLGLCAPA